MTGISSEARGERSIAVGGDVIRSILITGDRNRLFVGDYELLRDAYIEPWSVFHRVAVGGFIGRDWLTSEIDTFLATEDNGYFVLEASAGVGKTAYLAHLVAERGYIHHFVELARGPDGVAAGLRSMAAQIVRAGQLLPYSAEEVLPPAAGGRPDFFAHLLKRASDARANDQEKVVIVVDALDEAGTPIGHNVLGLPEILPRGVYLIVSQRPVPVRLDTEAPRRVFSLDANHEPNLEDMRRFLERAVASEPLAARVAAGELTSDEVVTALLHRSAGVWIYLHYVLADLSRGDSGPIDLDILPDGMWAYYARFWRRWRDGQRDAWYDRYLPLLATLAVVQVDTSADQLAALAGVSGGPALAALLDEDWLPILAVSEGEESHYRLYHASAREFLEGRLDREGRRAMDVALAGELERAVRQAHDRIAERYLRIWGGVEAGLPGLLDPAKHLLDGGYRLLHLTAHLVGSERYQDIDRLLRLETADGTRRNAWFTAHDLTGELSAYQADIARAWRLAEDLSDRAIGAGPTPGIAQEVRCALHVTSVNAFAASIPPPLLLRLVAAGIWSPSKGLAYAQQNPDNAERAKALGALGAETPVALLPALLGAIESLGDKYRASALTEVARHLPDGLLARAVRALAGTSEAYEHDAAAAGLVVALGRAGRWKEMLQLLPACPRHHREVVSAIASLVPQNHLVDACEVVLGNRDASERTGALAAMIPHLDAELVGKALLCTFEAGADLTDHNLSQMLAESERLLPAPPPAELLDIVRAWGRPWARSRGLTLLAENIEGRRDLVLEAVANAQAIPVEGKGRIAWGGLLEGGPQSGFFHRADALSRLLPLLQGDELRAVRDQAIEASTLALDAGLDSITQHNTWSYQSGHAGSGPMWGLRSRTGPWFGTAPLLLAARLPSPEAGSLIDLALTRVATIEPGGVVASVLVQLVLDTASEQHDAVLRQAEQAVMCLPDPKERVDLTLWLLPHLNSSSRNRLAADVIEPILEIESAATRLELLSRLAHFNISTALADAVHDEIAQVEELPLAIALDLSAQIASLPVGAFYESLLRRARLLHDEPARIEALAGLSPYLPNPQREAAIVEAVAPFEDGGIFAEDKHKRTPMRVRLARCLAAEGHAAQAIRVAEALPHSDNVWPSVRFQVLEDVATTLATSDLAAALQAVARITRADDHARALAAVESSVAHAVTQEPSGEHGPSDMPSDSLLGDEPGRHQDYEAQPQSEEKPAHAAALGAAQAIASAGKAGGARRAHLIIEVADQLDHELAQQALQPTDDLDDKVSAGAIKAVAARLVALRFPGEATAALLKLSSAYDGWDDSPLIVALLEHIALLSASGYLDEARDAALVLPERNLWGDPLRAQALTDLVERYIRTGSVRSGLACALAIDDDHDRSRALSAFADACRGMPRPLLLPGLRTLIGRAATLRRQSMLIDLGAFAPIIAQLGGQRAVEDIASAIEDTARWWP